MSDHAPFTVHMSVRRFKGESQSGYPNYEDIASFQLDADVGKAFSAFQAALEDLSNAWTYRLLTEAQRQGEEPRGV